MKVRIIGKTTATVGNSQIRFKAKSGKKYIFKKEPGVGYIFDGSQTEAEDIFSSQNAALAYYFTPMFQEAETEKVEEAPQVGSLDGKSLSELKEMCKNLGIEVLPQDKVRSMTRLLEAFKLGAGE